MTRKNWSILITLLVVIMTVATLLVACAPEVYTVKFVNEDGTVLQSVEVEAGQLPTYTGETPTKSATAEFTYTFSGWDNEPVAATGDATYTAQFTSVKNKYTVTFKNYDGTVLQTVQNVEYGTVAAYPADAAAPTKAEDNSATYVFSGWDKNLSAVTGNVEYVAQFTVPSTKRHFPK